MKRLLFIILFLFIALCHKVAVGQGINKQELPKKVRILFLLDASGSMLAKWENQDRMTAAKRLLIDIVDSLKANKNLELALRVYGHQFDRRYNNCTDSKLEVGFSPGNHETIKEKIALDASAINNSKIHHHKNNTCC